MSEKNKIKYQKNKEKIAAAGKETSTCNHCGVLLRKDSLRRHQKSKKCEELSKK